MDNDKLKDHEQETGNFASEAVSRHPIALLVIGAILISITTVSVALHLYKTSGTAQLDLSQPDLQSVRDQANKDDNIASFPSTGELNEQVFNDYRKFYDLQTKRILQNDSFAGKSLSDESLGFDTSISNQ